MKSESVFPQNETDLFEWLKNFTRNMEDIGPEFGITKSEISSLTVLVKSVKRDIVNGWINENDKVEKKKTVLEFVNRYLDRILNHALYKEEVHGRKLGIV